LDSKASCCACFALSLINLGSNKIQRLPARRRSTRKFCATSANEQIEKLPPTLGAAGISMKVCAFNVRLMRWTPNRHEDLLKADGATPVI
jgi:hypothetical protein